MKTRSETRAGRVVLAGVGGAIAGVLVGFLVGANVGGNWFTSVSIGSLHGYEATALLGAVIGGMVFGLGAIWMTLNVRS